MGKSVLVGYFADLFVRAPKLNYPAAMTQWLGKGAVSLYSIRSSCRSQCMLQQ